MSEDDYGSPETLQGAGVDAPPGSSGRPGHRKGPRFSWTPAYETTFFRSLCDSVNLGLKDNHSFKSEAWDRAITALAERHNAYPQKTHLINKSDNARKKFRLWRGLREDPEFLYNPKSRTVTASEEAWRVHIEQEPLSKSLRNRPFEHEQFMEILFPDVVGSGGAPKRITKPRRVKGNDTMQDSDDMNGAGSNVMDLLSPGNNSLPLLTSQTPIHPPTVPSNGTVRPASTLQNRPSIASSTALTPPDDDAPVASTSRKRHGQSNTTAAAEKRRRTAHNNFIDLTHPTQMMNIDPSMQDANILPNNYNQVGRHTNSISHTSIGAGLSSPNQLPPDLMTAFGEFARNFNNKAAPASPVPRWTELAMEIFFRDFSNEDADLQIKIGEKVLCDTNKATMFCMMPETLRQHWVKRLRELHINNIVSAQNSAQNNAQANNAPANNAQAAAITGSNGLINGGGIASMMQMNGSMNGGGIGRNGSQVG